MGGASGRRVWLVGWVSGASGRRVWFVGWLQHWGVQFVEGWWGVGVCVCVCMGVGVGGCYEVRDNHIFIVLS